MHTYVGEVDASTRRAEVWIETSGRSGRRPLRHSPTHSSAGFEWGFSGNGPADLAEAILRTELGLDVPSSVYFRFRDDVIATLPRAGFRLDASKVMDWARTNRTLIDAEIFGVEPPRPALSVVRDMHVDDAESVETADAEVGAPTASALVRACETAWDDIREHHPELPAVVVVLGTGVERGRLVKLGHWWSGRWVAEGQLRGEVLLAGEALHLPPSQVFEVLLHEAAHGINAARGVQDTSRGGRYHNQRFADTARSIGLEVSAMPPYGLARTELNPETEASYSSTIDRLGEAMRLARQLQGIKGVGRDGAEVDGGPGVDRNGADREERAKGSVGASCGCGRRMRMAPSVLARGPVVCGACGTEFTTGVEVSLHDARTEPVEANVVDRSFLARRRAALGSSRAETLSVLEDQRNRLAADLASRADIDARVAPWYKQFGTEHEQPMHANGHTDAAVLVELARAALAADGTLRGPSVALGGFELRAGDRVVVALAAGDGPAAGTPGTVESVDEEAGRCRIDFATWGELEVEAGSPLGRALRYDYVALEGASPQLHAIDAHLEIERGGVTEPELPF